VGTAFLLLSQIAAAAVLAATLWVAGKTAARRLAFDDSADELSTCVALGLGLVGTCLFALSAARLFQPLPLALLVLAVHALGWRTWQDLLARGARSGLRPGNVALLAALIFAGLPVFALTLYPPTAFDETLYHLPYAKAFAANAGLPFLETLRFPVAPQLAEIFCGALLLLAGDVAAHLPSALAFAAAALALASWIGARNPLAAGGAAALWLGNPLTAWLGGTAYVDLPLTLFGVLAWTWWDRWRQRGGTSRLALAGAFAGFAAATKYNGLLIVALLSAATAIVAVRRRDAAPLAKFLAIALLALAPWYARNFLQTGNPVFPLLPDLFGQNAWMTRDDLSIWQSGPRNIPASVSGYAASRARETVLHPLRLLEWPWTAAYRPSAFGGQPTLSPLLPLLIFLAAVGGLAERRMRGALGFAGALFLTTTAHDPRLLLPAIALLEGAAAVGLSRLLARVPLFRSKLAAALLALLLATPGAAYAGWKVCRQGPPPSGAAEREAYLSRSLRGYAQLALVNSAEGRRHTIYGLYFENLAYYAEGRFLGDWVGPYRYARVERALGSGTALSEEISRMQAGYLLVNVAALRRPLPQDEAFRQNFRLVADSGSVLLLERVGS
jgi:4-amino-4-deoxy-L-arabinose transferase-like glycosyltransferase